MATKAPVSSGVKSSNQMVPMATKVPMETKVQMATKAPVQCSGNESTKWQPKVGLNFHGR